MKFTESRVVLLIALARLAVCAYRAATQSIVHDEAFSYANFIGGPWASIYSTYDANNHFLYSILAKLSIRAFGVSELTIRLPSVLASFALTLGIWAVLRETASNRVARWLAFIALSLHPLLLDFSVAARGYGLGLALLVWAVHFAVTRRYWLSGMLSGFAISANLALAFPALAILCAALLLDPERIVHRIKALAPAAALVIAIPAAICYPALFASREEYFYAGAATIYESVLSIVSLSLHTNSSRTGLIGTTVAVRVITLFFLPLWSLLIAVRSAPDLRDPQARRKWIPLVACIVTALGWIAAHFTFGLSYPIDRMGLFFPLLFGIAAAVPRLHRLNIALAALFIVQFATQFQTRYLSLWWYDQDAREIVSQIAQESAGKPDASVSISATWYLQPALEFYRDRLKASALRPIPRQDPTPLTKHDFYVVHDTDVPRQKLSGYRTLRDNPMSGVLLLRE